MPDAHFTVAVRHRLRANVFPTTTGECQHTYVDSRRRCGHALDARGRHSRVCKIGGGVDARHNKIRDWLAKFVSSMIGREALTEQFAPHWNRVRRGVMERARLDFVYDNVQGRRVYVDVAVVETRAVDPHEVRQRAATDGKAAAQEEDSKRLRYPGPSLIPFVLESMGRLGESADALLRALVPADQPDRAKILGAARQSLSVALQMANAELMVSSVC